MINQNWIFPNNCGLNFLNPPNPPVPFTWNPNTITNAREGSASISDSGGNLLFYTDGISIWDSNHVLQYNQLLGNPSSTQSAIIVPDPANNNQYYIFTVDGSSHANPPWNHFDGVRVNINNLSTPTPIFPNILPRPSNAGFSPVEKVVAVQHANCRDFWIITIVQIGTDIINPTPPHNPVTNAPGTFRVFLVDPSGVTHVGDTPTPPNVQIGEGGYMKGSPNGQFLALANSGNANVLVYPFNNATGSISIPGQMIINAPATGTRTNVYGVEFSPDSNLIYYSNLVLRNTGNSALVWQVDFMNSLNSLQVGSFNTNANAGRYQIGALQLGIDGVIYIAKDGDTTLGAILNPNTVGIGCNVSNSVINLPAGSICQLGLPNLLPNPCPDSDCGCTGCNDNAEQQNDDLIQRATVKSNTVPSTNNDPNCPANPFPVPSNCPNQAIPNQTNLEPCFYFHWGDGANDQIEEHDTEVFYITVCNNFNDIRFKGLRITGVTLNPNLPISSAHIVPDRFITIDCLEPCSCETREFAIITRDTGIAGNYTLDVEYCYDEIVISSGGGQGTASFPLTITED